MNEEKYYHVEKVKECSGIAAFNHNIIKQTGKSLVMRTSINTKPENMGISVDEKTEKISCNNSWYQIKEITKEQAERALSELEKNYLNWPGHIFGENK